LGVRVQLNLVQARSPFDKQDMPSELVPRAGSLRIPRPLCELREWYEVELFSANLL
jgi:hypothetical protein